MIPSRLVFRVSDVDDPRRDAVRALGAEGDWSIFILNGHARAFATRGEGSFSIKWMAGGRARYGVERRARTVSRQAAMLVDQGQPYEMEFEARSGAQSFCLFFSEAIVREAWASQEAGLGAAAAADGPMRGFPNLPFQPSPALGGALAALEAAGPGGCEAALEGHALRALAEAVATAHRHRGLAARTPAATPATRAHLLASLERARVQILDAGGVGLELATLAREAGLSRFHLLRLFKAVYGATPMGFAEQVRLERAAETLAAGSASVGEAAAAAGYESPSAFAKAFRRRMGAPPGAWRT